MLWNRSIRRFIADGDHVVVLARTTTDGQSADQANALTFRGGKLTVRRSMTALSWCATLGPNAASPAAGDKSGDESKQEDDQSGSYEVQRHRSLGCRLNRRCRTYVWKGHCR